MKSPEKRILDPFYYLHNFKYLLGFVSEKSGTLLAEKERQFIDVFYKLPQQSQALYVRMCNRKGVYFKADKFNYSELRSVKKSLTQLFDVQFATALKDSSECDLNEVMTIFTKDELTLIFKNCSDKRIAKSIKRDEILNYMSDMDPKQIKNYIDSGFNVVKQEYSAEVAILKFMFFGSMDYDMSEFVIRDIGNAEFENYDEKKLSAYFTCRKELEDKFFISNAYKKFKEKREAESPGELYVWFKNHSIGELTEPARPVYNKLVNKLAYELERNSLIEEALEIYNLSDHYPSRERRIRILYQQNRTDEALALCREILNSSTEPKEKIFAIDFLNRSGRNYKTATRLLKEAEVIEIPYEFEERVEEGAMKYFASLGYSAFFSENYLWRSLFGLLFWEIIYDENTGTIHNPLQRAPSDIYTPAFYSLRKERMKECIRLFNTKKKLKARIRETWKAKFGKVNPLFGWDKIQLKMINKFIQYTQPAQLYAVLVEMSGNLKSNCTGFPDLFIYGSNEYFFAEIKSPNDHLSDQQVYWLDFFKHTGIKAKIIKVRWK